VTAAGEWVSVARIRRAQGRRGEVFAEILTDFPEKFSERRELRLMPDAAMVASPGAQPVTRAEPRTAKLTAHWLHKGGVVLHFAGVDSIAAAEALTGLIVAIPRAERAALDEDQAYIGDLIGCTLMDVAGAEPVLVGAIEDVDLAAGPVALLVVRGARGEVLVPFAKSYLRRLDVDGGRVEMALPQGLIELNASEAQG
jgi:16S rRNA processing protein RimM